MTIRSLIANLAGQESLNFALTNRIPRRLTTKFVGWFSRIEQPLVRDLSIGIWRLFSGLDLGEAKKQKFKSMHECFTRELKDGARPVEGNPRVLVSPCDGIIGANGQIQGGELMQIKGFRYTLGELSGDSNFVNAYQDGRYVTLRLTSSMYHRFHAPHDCCVEQVTYIPGDAFNVNPPALKRVRKLFCKNERAVIRTRLAQGGHLVTLVPVAAILVAGIRLNFLDLTLNLGYAGPRVIPCGVHYQKGQEMGWFEHGSTIIVFAPQSFTLCKHVLEGSMIRAGEPLMLLP